MKKRRAVVVGLEYYSQFLAQLVNEHSQRWTLRAYKGTRIGTVRALLAMRTADALISFGGPAPNVALIEAARTRNVPVIVIWAGSDVMKAQDRPFDLEVVKQERFYHLSDGPWLVDELAHLGLQAEYEPVTAVHSGGPVKPFPPKFRVLTYLPEPRRDFYGERAIYDVARAMPDVCFDVVGAGGRNPEAPDNVVFHGVVRDMERRIDESVVLLRQPEHDGKSMLVLEALARARHVVWNYSFPHVHGADGVPNVLEKLFELRRLHEQGELELNTAGRAFVLQNFARADVASRFEQRLEQAVSVQTANPRRRPLKVAMSGLGLFCAHIAQQARIVAPNWETRMLRTSSRLEVVTAILTLMRCDVWYSIGSPVTDRWVHLAARLLRKPRVIHWVGSDIASLCEHPRLRAALSGANVLHLAEISWTADQLREYGLSARIAPLPPRHRQAQCLPLPERFTVMLYVPRTRSDFYGRRAFEQLMRRLAGKPVRFLVVGGGTVDVPEHADVENLGWLDSLDGVYEQTTALIRFTKRDGLSLMVLEALSFGRHVLWTQQFPNVRHIADYDDIERHVLELLQAHERGELRPQYDASRLVDERYNSAECTRTIVRAWEDALHTRTPARLVVEGT